MNEISQFINRLKNFFKEFPSLTKWRHFLAVLNKKEKIVFLVIAGLLITSSFLINLRFYYSNTLEVPSDGGVYTEGLVGQPHFLNPLYLATQDADRDIVELIFSGLMKYGANGELVPDLIDNYEIKEGGLVLDVFLKKNLKWHDKKPLTVEDVLFTINLIQDPQYQSPLRIKWTGIAVEKIAGDGIRFSLPQKYSGFLENLTLKILPKHIFENITAQNMPWTVLAPDYLIGSGPFAFDSINQNSSGYIQKISVKRNEFYYGSKPHLKEVNFVFYESEDLLLQKASSGEIQGFSLADPQYFRKGHYDFQTKTMMMPRYFSLFFNQRISNAFTDKRLREALAISIDKEKILQEVFAGKGEPSNSPIMPLFFNFKEPSVTYNFDLAKANQLLNQAGYVQNPTTQKREKSVAQNVPTLFKTELKLKDQGEEIKTLQSCLIKLGFYTGTVDGIFGEKEKSAIITLQEKYADEILKPESLTRTKLNQLCQVAPRTLVPLSLTLTTSDKFPLSQVAEILEQGWENLGITVTLKKVSISDLQTDVLAKANFELLLFGEALGSLPDPFPFWHSSQKDYPGLNVAGYSSLEADKNLEKARESQTQQDLKNNLESFQNTLLTALPAIFIAQPDFVYFLSPTLQGFNTNKITEPAKRFSNIENWYLKTHRVWK
ncbi:MAG: ABC transporter substrate-binding protein [Candidatus Gribaldobacteria bacterium]|nr:ABC transporter substrate-binding protein [Candidatus Gribaldobacteria bacterium]